MCPAKHPARNSWVESGGRGRDSFSGEPLPMWPPRAERAPGRVPLGARDPLGRWWKTTPDPVASLMQGCLE